MTQIVLIGAGSAQFGFDTLGDIFSSKTLRGSTITLLDINPAALEHVATTAKAFIEANNLPFTLQATTDRREALKGANFIVISIEVGDRFKLWEQDRTVPQQFGIKQVYGENGGAGGLFHALRIIPSILEICEDIQQICPDAHVFNFSNPMSRICTTVHRKFPKLNFVGLCHEIASLERHLPQMLGVDFDDLELIAGGLNHFSCLLEAKYKTSGQDAYGDIREKAPGYFKDTPASGDFFAHAVNSGEFIATEGVRNIDRSSIKATREWSERRLIKYVLKHFDLLPITSDSHFGEYLGWAHEVSDHQGIIEFYRYYQMYLINFTPEIDLTVRERLIPIIEGIINDRGHLEAAANIPNRGFIKELPEHITVEVPALIDRNGVNGVKLPDLPAGYAGLLQNQIAIHNMTTEAVLTRSKKAVIQALLVDPTVDKAICIPELVDVMVDLQIEHLHYFKD